MGYDPFSPIAPALINILCVPASRLKPNNLNLCLQWLQKVATVLARPGRGAAGSSDTPLLLRFGAHLGANALTEDSFFEPNRQPQIVLGLIDGSALPPGAEDVRASLQQTEVRLKQAFLRDSRQEIPVKLVVFDAPGSSDPNDAIFVKPSLDQDAPDKLVEFLSQATAHTAGLALKNVRTRDVELPHSAIGQSRLNEADPRQDSRTDSSGRQSVVTSLGRTPTQTSAVLVDESEVASSGKTVSAALSKLQMGLWTEALDQFADGARAARDANSPAWHAKALEGVLVCMLLHAWTGKRFEIPQNCYPTIRGLSSGSAIHAIADANRTLSERSAGNNANRAEALTAILPGLLATIMNLYEKSAIGFDNGLPGILICEARVRLAVLLVIIRKHNGLLNSSALQEIVGSQNQLRSVTPANPPTIALTLPSSALASLLIESITEAQAQLPLQTASTICIAVCQQLSELRLERKHGFYLKEVLQKLPPLLVEARKVGAAQVAVHLLMSGISAFVSGDKDHQMVAESVSTLLQIAIRVYGLPELSRPAIPNEEQDHQGLTRKRLSSWLSVFISGDIATKLEVLRLCIRVSDALPDPVGSVKFMSLLLFVTRQTVSVTSRPPNAVPLISLDEQTRLYSGIHNTVDAARRLGNTMVLADYWDDFLIRSVDVYESPESGRLMAHSSQDLSITTASGTSKKDPFIYNPFTGDLSSSGPAVLVKDEIASFEVLLQNPLEVHIEIESIALVSEGCDFASKTHSVIIGPLCIQTFTLRGTPKTTGALKITGCKAKVKNCHEKDFMIYTGIWKPPQFIKRQHSLADLDVGLPESKCPELNVVDPLPQLHVSTTSLIQNSTMLLDGEKRTFSVTLENPGDISADLVLFSYQDSVSRHLQDALSNKELQPADTYELQYQLTTRPAMRRILSDDVKGRVSNTAVVAASSKQTFYFEILGKPGLTEAVILIDYTYLGKPRKEVEGAFYTRQIRFPISITVNGSVDIPRCNILSLPATTDQDAITTGREKIFASTSPQNTNAPTPAEQGRCLLQLDLRSIWQTPVLVTIETTADPDQERPEWETATTVTLLPTQTTRTLTLFPRLYIVDPTAPIPSLSTNRQFVVSASKLTLEAELTGRESFWYREELCKRLRIRWKEEFGSGAGKVKREGEIDVRRGLRVSGRMIDALRIEHVQIGLEVEAVRPHDADIIYMNANGKLDHPEKWDDGGAVVKKGGVFEVKRNVFVNVVVKVQNMTQEDLRLLLRLQPALQNQPHNLATDLSKKFVWTGVLQRVLPRVIKKGETSEVELSVVCLVVGDYEVNATVEEVRSRRHPVEGVMDVGGAERRIWHARRPCHIRAVD